MRTPPKPKKVVAPEGCEDYLTAGKEYEVTGVWSYFTPDFGHGINIISDNGFELLCLEISCPHLDGKNWIITEYETP